MEGKIQAAPAATGLAMGEAWFIALATDRKHVPDRIGLGPWLWARKQKLYINNMSPKTAHKKVT